MPTTSNFGWTTPADTDLVKDGAAAIRTLGNGIDTSFLDLKGGSTDQVLAKNSNTDLDFKWVAQDDSNAIQNAIVDAKGDLISATAADTPARLAVGTDGQFLSADSSTSTGLKWAVPSGGGMTLLSTTTLSGSSTTITIDPTGYNKLQFDIFLVDCSADANWSFKPNNSTSVLMRIQDGAQNTYADGIAIPLNTDGTLKLTTTTNAWTVIINNVASSTSHKPIWFYGGGIRNSNFGRTVSMGYGRLESNSTITSFVFACSAGTFNGGTIKTYGVK